MPADPILALQSLGYTEREASFLHLVAVHSGYFLRRQFDYFIDRQPGAIAQRFLEKTRSLGHVRYVDCGESRYVYQLFSKPIYRLIGNADSQNRRWKGDGMIRARLMALDYVLENEDAHFLISETAKTHFFSAVRRIPDELFADCNGRLLPLLATFPISVADRTQSASSTVRLLFPDEALLTEAKFRRFLSQVEGLLWAIGNFEVIYTATSEYTFPLAEEEFWKHFSDEPPDIQRTFADDWRGVRGPATQKPSNLNAKFSTLLLKYSYPQLRRKESPTPGVIRRPSLQAERQLTKLPADRAIGGSSAG